VPGHHIIVGGGLAGLTAAMKLAEQGEQVDLFSIVPVKRSHSVCAQGGINGAVNTKGEGDSPMIHFDDTIYGGDFLAHQPPVKAMCEAAPAIIYLFDRMGVMFNRTPEGLLDFRRFGGTKHHRTAFAGATTGQQLLYALDEQVRRYEADGLVRKFEGWEMLSLVQDESGDCRGIVAIDTRSLSSCCHVIARWRRRWWLSRVTAPRTWPIAIIASYCRCHPSCTTPRVLTLATFCRRHARPTLSGQTRSTA